MPKYKEIDYKAPKSRWPLWIIPFLVAILLLLIGIFIFVTLGAKHHCLFFDCEQPIDKVISPPDELPRDDAKSGPDFSRNDGNKPQSDPGFNRGVNKTGTADRIKKITVHGELIFEGAPDSLPAKSYLQVKFEDVSLMDAASVVLGDTVVDLASYDKAKNLKYKIECKKPDPSGSYSVSALLNMGWQRNKDSWIKSGDYHTDTHHDIKIEDGKSDYAKNITLVRYN